MGTTTKLNIGKIPVSKGEYQDGTSYQRLNQVTMLGSTYQSKIDDNTSAHAQIGADGAVENINTDKWLCVAVGNVSAARKVVYNNETSGLEAGNVQEAIDEVGSKVSDLSNNNFRLQSALFASLLRTNIFAAMIDNHYHNINNGEMMESQLYACLTLFPIETGSFIIKLNLYGIGVVEYDSNRKFIRKNPSEDISNNVETEVTLGEGTRYVGVYGQKNSVTYSSDSFKDSYIIINGVSDNKIDKSSIVQKSGEAEDKVMSQKAVSDKLSDLSNLSSDISLKNRIIKNTLVNIATGKTEQSDRYDCTDFIPVNKSIYVTLPNKDSSAIFYDSDKKYIKNINPVTEHGLSKYVYDDATIAYIRINQVKGSGSEPSYDNSYAIKADFIGNVCLGLGEEIADLGSDITCISLKNRIIKNTLVNIATGKTEQSDRYDCTDFIPVNKSIYVTLPNKDSSAIFYDSDKKYIKNINPVTEHGLSKYVYDDATIAYIRINQVKGSGSEPSYDNSYAIKADFIGNACLGVEENGYNELYGKKWCCCGDSFSVAGYNVNDGIPQDVYVYQDGPYKGKQKVYGTMIALRNSMNFVNIANGGMTMCNIDGTRTNSFTYNDYYKKIPLDSDYVTIKFGINDGNFNSPIGTIDDEVVTTFYGAWNVVLKWIRNNLPFTKVGIIVSSGLGKTQSSDNLAEATRNVAQKWGIPILDEINDKTIPLLHRTNRPGISSDVYDLLIEKFSVNTATGNTHPNVKAHEFESTFVEAFIRKL